MARGTMKRYLSMCLVIVMLLTTLLPVGAYAADDSAIEDTATNYEEPVASELEDVSVELEDQESEQVDDTSAVTEISDYATFLSCFKVLEGYAQTYTEENVGENANALIINYIRTGVERYTSGTWEMVCGKENTAFTAYVSEQDTANNTSASALKNINNFTLPNGNKVDLGHVFGAMDVANYAKVQGMTDAVVQARADMGSWAGDITDLMYCAENVDIADKVDTTETDVDTLAANIRARYLGVDYGTLNSVDHSFTDTDLYGDMDAFYLTTEMNRGGVALSTIIENYFTAGLTDASRASYFLTNRLGGMVTKDGIRSKVMSTYTGNTLIGALESSYSLTDLSNYETLRKACCYAFADYLFDLAGDPNGTDPVDPDPDPEPDPEPDDAYYSVFSSDTTTVAPGVTQTINYALTKDDKQIVYYIATADISRDDVSIHANYHANDPSQGWAMSRVSDQMTAAQKRHSDPADTANYVEHYNAVVGVNADFYNMTTGAPSGALVMEGVEYHGVASENFFAILKDGTAMIGSSSDYAAYKDQIQEAVGGSVYLVKDGKSVVTSAADYYNSRHSRTCVGITAEGKVVLMVLDGRQEPFSAGGSAEELAQIMLDAGCVTAINLDGGGSTTFVAKQEGSNTLTVVNRPSDGYERSVSSSLMVVSTAPVSTEFDHALITSAYDYLTSGAAVRLIASGVSVSGSAAELPADITWKSADETIGKDANGKQYYKDGELQKTGWTVIDGETYYLDTETGYAATGITTLIPNGATETARCVFDAEGVFQSDVTGVYSVGEDTYWLNSGIIEEEAGLKRVVKENGEVNYYYFAVQKNLEEREGLTLSAAVKSTVLNGKDCWLHKTNGLALPEWGYYFDENGVILHDEDTSKNGILKDGEDLFYYVDGIKAPAGMIKIGDDYYYANSKGQLIVNQTYYCSRMNGLMEEGTYAFDAEGKLIQGATDKNGIVKDDDGVLRYYVNGKVTYVGLIEIDGDFYYVRSNGEVVTDCVYWITWTHGLKEAGYYTFDENGKLTGTPKNGIVEEDGVLHYYVNGKLTYAGLIKIGDDYYYVNSKCEVVRDCDYYISWTHDLMPQGRYHFDADGKLTGSVAPLKNGIYEEDGSLYFYRNGERAYAGLIQIDGDYYYVRSTCEVVHDRSYYVYWTHGLMPEGYYNFDSAGRMILNSETE